MKGRNVLYDLAIDTEKGAEGKKVTIAGYNLVIRETGKPFNSLRKEYQNSFRSKMEKLVRRYNGEFDLIRLTLYGDGSIENIVDF